MSNSEPLTLDNGRLTVAPRFQPILQAAGLESFDRFMTLPADSVVRAVPGRSTVRINLPGLTGYLKRYEPSYLSAVDRLLRAVHWPGRDDEAAREWRKLHLLQQHGFLTAAPVALGQERRGGVVVASFLLQQEIPTGVSADEYLPRLPTPRRRQLLAAIGTLARRFQDAGFIHKDFYLKHIFVVERGDAWDLYLIDLQRVLGPRRHRARWYLKDLAALAFSARRHAGLSRTDLLRIHHAFRGDAPTDPVLVRRIWARAQRLARRTPKYKRVWNEPPHD